MADCVKNLLRVCVRPPPLLRKDETMKQEVEPVHGALSTW